jgi:hypothetical protein
MLATQQEDTEERTIKQPDALRGRSNKEEGMSTAA